MADEREARVLFGVILGPLLFAAQWATDDGWRRKDGALVRRLGFVSEHSVAHSGHGFVVGRLMCMAGFDHKPDTTDAGRG